MQSRSEQHKSLPKGPTIGSKPINSALCTYEISTKERTYVPNISSAHFQKEGLRMAWKMFVKCTGLYVYLQKHLMSNSAQQHTLPLDTQVDTYEHYRIPKISVIKGLEL